MALDRDTLNRLYRYCHTLAGDEDGAYTLLQASVEQYLKASSRGVIEAPVPYVRRIIRNRFIDGLRRQQRFPEVGLDETEGIVEIGVQSLENQLVAALDIDRIWRDLNPMEREVLHLWAVEGFSTREIAEQTDTPRNTILSRIHRIRQKLQAKYSASGGAAS